MLGRLAAGAGMIGLAGLLQRAGAVPASPGNPGKTEEYPTFAPHAKRVIFLFLNGGPSQVEMFDHKPKLPKSSASPFAFAPHGESGLELSELLGRDRLEALKRDLVRIVESRGGEVTALPAPPATRSRTAR